MKSTVVAVMVSQHEASEMGATLDVPSANFQPRGSPLSIPGTYEALSCVPQHLGPSSLLAQNAQPSPLAHHLVSSYSSFKCPLGSNLLTAPKIG